MTNAQINKPHASLIIKHFTSKTKVKDLTRKGGFMLQRNSIEQENNYKGKDLTHPFSQPPVFPFQSISLMISVVNANKCTDYCGFVQID